MQYVKHLRILVSNVRKLIKLSTEWEEITQKMSRKVCWVSTQLGSVVHNVNNNTPGRFDLANTNTVIQF